MGWSFATINNKTGEIYFDKDKNGKIKFLNHCYVKREDFKNKQEQKCFNKDIRTTKIIYRNKKYRLV